MFTRLFKKSAPTPASISSIDLHKIDSSFNLLKATAVEVAQEATNAAAVLEKEQQRTKACFIALNSASDIIFIVDEEENIFFVNDQFIHEFGYTTHHEVVGKTLGSVLSPISEHCHVWDHVRENKTWQGPFGKYDMNVLPIMNGQPHPIYYVCTFKTQKAVAHK